MASVSYDPLRDGFLIRIAQSIEINPIGIAEEVQELVKKQLAEEFLKKYRDGILGAINADDIAYKFSDAIAEVVKRKLLGDTNEPA